MREDTIAAIGTPSGQGGIGIVRVSGPDAVAVGDRLFHGKCRLSEADTHTIHYGTVRWKEKVLDEVLVSVFLAPHSYTGEDTVEINCHGGNFVLRRILEAALEAGARSARPGEFTERAFLNGKMDLARAEAVMDVIQSKNKYALDNAVGQLKGNLSGVISRMREDILYETAYIEAALDDPEHMSLEGYSERLKQKTEELLCRIQKLIASFDSGRMLKEGVRTAILGRPNAGKSTLLNALLREEKAIVTDIAGTTRDVLEASAFIGGTELLIMDTAGIRDTDDRIEQIGVERALECGKKADLVLYVLDSSQPAAEEDMRIIRMLSPGKVIVLLNKTDMEGVTDLSLLKKMLGEEHAAAVLEISARERTGVDRLEQMIGDLFFRGDISFNDEIYITNIRQKEALTEAKESLELVLDSIRKGMPEDFYSIDLMNAYEKLGLIIGEQIEEDLADKIFGTFCMGK